MTSSAIALNGVKKNLNLFSDILFVSIFLLKTVVDGVVCPLMKEMITAVVVIYSSCMSIQMHFLLSYPRHYHRN